MRKTMSKALRQLLAFCMVLAVVITSLGVTEVKAAEKNKALQLSLSFDGMNDESEDAEENEKCWINNSYAIYMAGSQEMVSVKGLKTSATVYVPKKMLDQEGAKVDLSTYLDLNNKKGKYVGAINGLISIRLANEDGKIKIYAWDCKKEKNVKAGSYAKCKKGKGAYKSYYVIQLKNMPGTGEMIDTKDKVKKLTSRSKYGFNMGLSITGLNYKGSVKMYVDNVKVTSGKKTIASQNFTQKPKDYGVYNKDKKLKKSKVKIVKF